MVDIGAIRDGGAHMQIELTDVETEYLQRTLTSTLSELRGEIEATETRDFKAQLERDEDMLRAILGRLGVPVPSDR
jgi:hypothetical protein